MTATRSFRLGLLSMITEYTVQISNDVPHTHTQTLMILVAKCSIFVGALSTFCREQSTECLSGPNYISLIQPLPIFTLTWVGVCCFHKLKAF